MCNYQIHMRIIRLLFSALRLLCLLPQHCCSVFTPFALTVRRHDKSTRGSRLLNWNRGTQQFRSFSFFLILVGKAELSADVNLKSLKMFHRSLSDSLVTLSYIVKVSAWNDRKMKVHSLAGRNWITVGHAGAGHAEKVGYICLFVSCCDVLLILKEHLSVKLDFFRRLGQRH